MALDAQGSLWAVWEVDDGTDTNVYYSSRDAEGWQAPRPLSADAEAGENSPSLALATDGTLWAAWSQSTGPDQASIWVSHWWASGWSSPTQVAGTAMFRGQGPTLASAPDGGLWLAWVGHDGTDREIFVSRWDGTTWSAPQRVGNDDVDPQAYDLHPALAVDNSGSVWLAWTSHEGWLNDEIHASHWNGLTWSPQQLVSSSDDTPDAWPSITLDQEGLPWIAWHGVAAEDENPWRIFVSQWDRTKSAWRAEVLASSPVSLPVDEQHPSLTLDAKGQLHLAWALSGELSGLAHTTWDGTNWASPSWMPADQPIGAPTSLADGEPSILWLLPDAGQEAPVQQEPLQEMKEPLPQSLPSTPESVVGMSVPVPNRHLAHGDSITLGAYTTITGEPVIPYPTMLEELLDNNTADSQVINWGKNAEKARAAESRLAFGVQTYTPQFVLILEGTNDIHGGYSPAETAFAVRKLIWIARDKSGVSGLKVMIGTLVPRRDPINDLIPETNTEIAGVAQKENVPLADPWQAFYNYGPWEQLYVDTVHPNTAGLKIIAETFFQKMVELDWLILDNKPPTAWISYLLARSECADVQVGWEGQDPAPGTGIKNFDVQVSENSSIWTNWLLETPDHSGTYTDGTESSKLYFRVRARDEVDNVGLYSAAQATNIVDIRPPYQAQMDALPPAQKPPFELHWWGADACTSVTFDVEYRAGASSTWTRWRTAIPGTHDTFNPGQPDYGKTYSFRIRARDKAGNVTAWSDTISTILAKHTIEGNIVTVRHQPVNWAQVTATGALHVESGFGYYTAYLANDGSSDLSAQREGFGVRPPMHLTQVTTSLSGRDFVLPPLDDVVGNGGFEGSTWGAWQRSGSPLPTFISGGHTGDRAARLGGGEGTSRLQQTLSLPGDLENATLSFLVKLDGASGSNAIKVGLTGTSLSWTIPVSPGGWTHIWRDVGDAVGQGTTLTLTVSGSPAVLLDEVSLGSAASGGSRTFMPLISQAITP